MSPPVNDSARPIVKPPPSSSDPTACSIDSSSTPNTRSPSNARNSDSSASMSLNASLSSAAFAVMRTFSPSTPLARKASVGLPVRSRYSMRSASTSARPDSLSPHVRRVRLTMAASMPERCRRSGRTAFAMISRISYGTPGTA
jgi:hypothetical protein